MEIGNEIGQKIRSAIKAKLVELGAYVDDELPDYIMVMVANRKTEEQMAEDLSLFLSNNTTKFTTWLHNLLEKLQSMTTNESGGTAEVETGRSKPMLPSSRSPRVTQEPPQEQPVAITAAKPSGSGHRKSTDSVAAPVMPSASQTRVDEEPVSKLMPEHGRVDKEPVIKLMPEHGRVREEPVIKLTPEHGRVDEEPVMKLTPEHDEFEEEGILEKLTPISRPQMKSDAATAVGEKLPGVKEPRKESRRISVGVMESKKRTREEEEYVPQPVISGQQDVKKRLGAVAGRPSVAKYAKTTSATVGGRRALGSSVGAVLQHNVDEEEEGYDPRKPAIGNVASVIKVTERRSSVPVSLQANKSLLMKAMQQAEQSVAKARRHLISAAPASSAAAESKQTDRPVQTDPSQSERSQSERSQSGWQVTKTVRLTEADTHHQTLTDVQRSAVGDVKTVSVAALTSSDLRRTLSDVTHVVRRHGSEPSVAGQLSVAAAESETGMITEESLDLMEQDDDNDSMDSEEDGLRQLLLLQQTNVKRGQRAGSPKFVVTLDGADESLSEMDTVDAETLLARSSASARNVVRVKPQTQALARLEESPVDDDVAMTSASSATKLHAKERCKFWPACKNGDACQFHHPTQPCKTFPACRFGDSCLFIHPNCKFDASCRNARCPFTHSCPCRLSAPSPAIPVIVQPVRVPVYVPRAPRFPGPRAAAPKQTRCKFFPRCTDMNCPFLHPKPCRYGLNCAGRQTSCLFSHPEFPDKHKMKWTAPKAGSSGSS